MAVSSESMQTPLEVKVRKIEAEIKKIFPGGTEDQYSQLRHLLLDVVLLQDRDTRYACIEAIYLVETPFNPPLNMKPFARAIMNCEKGVQSTLEGFIELEVL